MSSIFRVFGVSLNEQFTNYDEGVNLKGFLASIVLALSFFGGLSILSKLVGRTELRNRMTIELYDFQILLITLIIFAALLFTVLLIRKAYMNKYVLGIYMSSEEERDLTRLTNVKINSTALNSKNHEELIALQHKLEAGMLKVKDLKKLKKIIY